MKWLSLDRVCNHTYAPGLLSDKSVVVDLGANRGDFLRGIGIEKCYRRIAVEPNPELAKQLVSYGFEVHTCAISREIGESIFSIGTNLESSSLGLACNNDIAKRVAVATTDFMSWARSIELNSVDLLKMDIEGEEICVLESIPDSFLSKVIQLTVEFHDFAGVSVEKIQSAIKRFELLGFFVVPFSKHTFGDVWFLNKRLTNIGLLNEIYLRNVYRNVKGLERILNRWLSKS